MCRLEALSVAMCAEYDKRPSAFTLERQSQSMGALGHTDYVCCSAGVKRDSDVKRMAFKKSVVKVKRQHLLFSFLRSVFEEVQYRGTDASRLERRPNTT